MRLLWSLFFILFLLFPGRSESARAQAADQIQDRVFVKVGAGFSDYTGDYPIQNRGHPFDLQEFNTGNGFPFLFTGELGYRLSPKWSVALNLQAGNYPIIGYGGPGDIESSSRLTQILLARRTFGSEDRTVKPYVDFGLNVTSGGSELTSPGIGPSIGGGVDIVLTPKTTLFVESRFNLAVPDDAIDGVGGLGYRSSSAKTDDPKGSVTGSFDMANQLLGFGVKYTLPSPTPSEPAPGEEETLDRTASFVDSTYGKRDYDPDRYEDMVLVPDGTFIMGLTDQDPLSVQNAGRKRVTVSAFYIDQYEVTTSDYREYLQDLSPEERETRLPDSTAWTEARSQKSWGAYFRGDFFSDHPVLAVTWDDARAYCQAQNKRLPTEAEWEYAARAGHTGRVYPWEGLGMQDGQGNYLANYNPSEGYAFDGYAFTAPVGTFPPNDWGLYDMAGNVAEWTQDDYTPSYNNISDFNPSYDDEEESRRVVRGGAWNSSSFFIGVGVRDTQPRDEASATLGFRCVHEVTGTEPGEPVDSAPDSSAGENSSLE